MARVLRTTRSVILIAVLAFFLAPPVGEAQTETLRVATREVKPFVFEQNGSLTGFSIDLWQEIAGLLGDRTDYVMESTVNDLLDATRSGQADLAIAAISITSEREQTFDFSQPMFDAGLQILIPADSHGSGIGSVLGTILSPDLIPFVIFLVAGVLLAGHIVWLFERRRPDGAFRDKTYIPGIFDATFWATSALATQAEMWPKSAVARVVAVVWMFAAVVFVAVFTASVTTSATVSQLRSDIQGPDDLPGKRVATVQGSTSAEYLRGVGSTMVTFPAVDDAIRSLESGDVEAVVYDAPVLQYYASHEGKGKVQVVGSVFKKESYGILFPDGSPLRKQVNEALLRLRENGDYDRLMTTWFGGPSGKAGG